MPRAIRFLSAVTVVLALSALSFTAASPAYATDTVTLSSGDYTATQWNSKDATEYYRIDGYAIVDDHDGRVQRSANAIAHGDLDSLGRATWAAGYITPKLWAKESKEDRESTRLPNPVGWTDNKEVEIALYEGKSRDTYRGYFYNRSHLVADSLGGDPIKENLVTGTRMQNVGANDGKGGMAYSEEKARAYMKKHPKGTLYYSATPVYVGNELVPRSVYVDMKSDDGKIDEHIEVYNTALGYSINYADGSWGKGDPNETRTGAPNAPASQKTGTFLDDIVLPEWLVAILIALVIIFFLWQQRNANTYPSSTPRSPGSTRTSSSTRNTRKR